MTPIAWVITLLLIGVVLLVMEAFIPSGGIIGILALASFAAATFTAFTQGPKVGGIVMLTAFGITSSAIYGLIKFWPHSPIGKLIVIRRPTDGDVLPHDEHYESLKSIIGDVGTTVTALIPGGVIQVKGKKFDAVSEGIAIEAGKAVKVVAMRTNTIIVRPTAESPTPQTIRPDQELLNQPLDAFGLVSRLPNGYQHLHQVAVPLAPASFWVKSQASKKAT